MPDWIAVTLLAIIEGLTEFIPVSSTGHLLIAENLLKKTDLLSQSPSDLFNVVIQCGAVVAVIPLFWNRCREMVCRWREPGTRNYILKIGLAFMITGAMGVILEKTDFKLPESQRPVALALLIGGALFILIERALRSSHLRSEVTWPIAVVVGVGQLIAAVFPGSSRSGSTILLALLLGLSRPAATEFSFLVGIPTMLAAGGLKIFKALHHGAAEDWGMVLLGTVASAFVSFLAVKWLLRYVQSHSFEVFGWYRILVGIALLVLVR